MDPRVIEVTLWLFLVCWTATPLLGQVAAPSQDEGVVALNEAGDLILNSGTNRSVLANGVDIVARFRDLETLTVSQGATINRLNSTVTENAAVIDAISAFNAAVCPSLENVPVISTIEGYPVVSGKSLTALNFCTVTTVPGLLYAQDNLLTSITFVSLTSISGDLYLYNNLLTRITFVSLKSVGNDLYLYNNKLTSINFGSLESVGRDLYLYDNKITSVAFSSLTSIGSDLYLQSNPIAAITFPSTLSIADQVAIGCTLKVACETRYGPKCSC